MTLPHTLICQAHAKINLTLDVGARRTDGYHEIRSILQTIALHDTLTVSRTPDSPGVRLEVTGEQAAGVPADASNLVHKAAVRLQKIAAALQILPGSQSGLQIGLHKRIPSQAGLGGGSSDAAAALHAVSRLLGLALSPARLCEIGAALGSDVPFFLSGGTALAEGLGEEITPLPPLAPDWPLVLVKPAVGVSTPTAYGALDALTERRSGQSTQRWLEGRHELHNDFESVILPSYPEIASVYNLLAAAAEREKGFGPLLCGSGSTLFLRVSSRADAEAAARRLEAAGAGQVWITQTESADAELSGEAKQV